MRPRPAQDLRQPGPDQVRPPALSAGGTFQGISERDGLVLRELDDQSPPTLERDTHDDAPPLLGDLEWPVASPRLHRRHPRTPFMSGAHTGLWIARSEPRVQHDGGHYPAWRLATGGHSCAGTRATVPGTRQDDWGERQVRPLRPLRRPPAVARRSGAGRLAGRPARSARHRAARRPHRGLAHGQARLVAARPDRRVPGLRVDGACGASSRGRGRPHLPHPRGRRLGRPLASTDPRAPGGSRRTRPVAQRPGLSGLCTGGRLRLGRSAALARARRAARLRAGPRRTVRGGERVRRRRPGAAGMGPRSRRTRVRAVARRCPSVGRRDARGAIRRGRLRRAQSARPRMAQVPVHRPWPAAPTAAGSLARRRRGVLLRLSGRTAATRQRPLRRSLPVRPVPLERSRPVNSPVLYAVDDGVATITLNRPDAMNSLDTATKVALREHVLDAAADAEVRAVVLTGSGRAFCVGQDLNEHAESLAEDDADLGATVQDHYSPVAFSLATMSKPVIAAVNGVAAGGGAELSFAWG